MIFSEEMWGDLRDDCRILQSIVRLFNRSIIRSACPSVRDNRVDGQADRANERMSERSIDRYIVRPSICLSVKVKGKQ